MFERFTEKARRVIFFARYEASEFGSSYIETEHLLLGLLREDKALFFRVLRNIDGNSIRQEVTTHTPFREKVATSVDLPLSNESKRVLSYSAEEAEGMNHKHIGTEHLLLGLLREKKSLGAQLLIERGAELENLRVEIAKEPVTWAAPPKTYPVPARKLPPVIQDTITIHGSSWSLEYVRATVSKCREYAWHWQKRSWTARDIVVARRGGTISFDLSLASDTANFELLKAGWKKDHCTVCRWELFESNDDQTHGTAYTNGRDWLCTECYEKFIAGPDFFSSSYSDLT